MCVQSLVFKKPATRIPLYGDALNIMNDIVVHTNTVVALQPIHTKSLRFTQSVNA